MRRVAALSLLLFLCSARAELFVSSHDSSQVFRFNETNFTFIDIFIPNTTPRLQFPHGLAFGPDGNLYVASAGNDRVIRYNGQTGAYMDDFISAGSGGLDYPVALIFRGTNLFVSSQLNDRVLRYNATSGQFIDTFVVASANLDGPSDMQFHRDGTLHVVGRFNNRVCRYNGQTGALIDTFINSNLNQPFGLRILPSHATLVVSGSQNAVQAFNSEGTYFRTFINTGSLNFPIGIIIALDELLIASYGNDKVARFNYNTGAHIGDITAPGLNGPNFMIFRPSLQPTLNFQKIGDDLQLSWSNNPSPNFRLSDSPQASFFDTFPYPATTSTNGTNSILVPMVNSSWFFRLEKPY